MEESSTLRAFIEEGRQQGLQEGLEQRLKEGEVLEARRIILRLGRKRFGEAGDAVVSRLDAISNVGKLEQLVERLFDISSWDELFSGQ